MCERNTAAPYIFVSQVCYATRPQQRYIYTYNHWLVNAVFSHNCIINCTSLVRNIAIYIDLNLLLCSKFETSINIVQCDKWWYKIKYFSSETIYFLNTWIDFAYKKIRNTIAVKHGTRSTSAVLKDRSM